MDDLFCANRLRNKPDILASAPIRRVASLIPIPGQPGTPLPPCRECCAGDIGIRGIWALEMHHYRGRYYLFLTFDTSHLFPEQWRNWRPRVTRGSQVLVSDSPLGPFTAFDNRSTFPPDMMTLDAMKGAA
jgi:hypothetical protein